MKILLVDDHALFVEGLKYLLESQHYEVLGTARDGFEALEQVRALNPEVVLMDVNMPNCTGIEGTRLIKAEFPQVKVVMLTVSSDDKDLFEAIKAGASGYIVKDVKPALFLELLSGVTRGEAAITREMATRIMGEFMRTEGGRSGGESQGQGQGADAQAPRKARRADEIGGLTARQTEILRCVAEGYRYKEIATRLSISERTVYYHMVEILNKLQLQNRAQVIAYATRHGLVQARGADGTERA